MPLFLIFPRPLQLPLHLFTTRLKRAWASVVDPWHFGTDPDADLEPRIQSSV